MTNTAPPEVTDAELLERLRLIVAWQAVMLKEQAEKIEELESRVKSDMKANDIACKMLWFRVGELEAAVAQPHDRLTALEAGLAGLTVIVHGRKT